MMNDETIIFKYTEQRWCALLSAKIDEPHEHTNTIDDIELETSNYESLCLHSSLNRTHI